MPKSGYDIEAIAAEAENYLTLTTEELEYRFDLARASSSPSERLPHRGNNTFWQNIRQRLTEEIVKSGDSVAVTTGMVTTVVVHWIEQSGVNLTGAEFPISLFVALVTKSVIAELKSRNKPRKPLK